jgi:hypothetical protein
MPNIFPARERKFIGTLAEDLHLYITWDEYDAQDQNLVIWRFPGTSEQPLVVGEEHKANDVPNGEGEDEAVNEDDESEDEESNAAVDRVLKKYEQAPVMVDDEDNSFDARYERSMKDKMDEWKKGYYKVCSLSRL